MILNIEIVELLIFKYVNLRRNIMINFMFLLCYIYDRIFVIFFLLVYVYEFWEFFIFFRVVF